MRTHHICIGIFVDIWCNYTCTWEHAEPQIPGYHPPCVPFTWHNDTLHTLLLLCVLWGPKVLSSWSPHNSDKPQKPFFICCVIVSWTLTDENTSLRSSRGQISVVKETLDLHLVKKRLSTRDDGTEREWCCSWLAARHAQHIQYLHKFPNTKLHLALFSWA